MLILNRKPGESIIIDDDIEIKILESSDGRVKIGIDAPKEITILREEIYREVEEENKKSLTFSEKYDMIKMLKE